MKITALVENTSRTGIPTEHGLSLYIECKDGRNILFDMGQGTLFAENAIRLGLSVTDVDLAIVSHGHYDHGGGLRTFLEINNKANVYIHKDAFLPHYSIREGEIHYIGLDKDIEDNPRLIICDGKTMIDDSTILLSDIKGNICYPPGNNRLLGPTKNVHDNFCHEQNLVLHEDGKTILFAGCAHRGIANILRSVTEVIGTVPDYVFSGMHLMKNGLSKQEEDIFIHHLADELAQYPGCTFFTMHCTGTDLFLRLKDIMGTQMNYLSCGEKVSI